MTAATSHNRGRSQVNFWFLQIGGDFQYINHLKSAQEWTLVDNSTFPAPDTLNSNGYPISISNGGVYTVFFIPSHTARSVNWVIGWIGEGTIYNLNTKTTVSGSASGVNGRWVISTSDTRIVLGISSINASNPITSLWFVPADEETSFLGTATSGQVPNGEVFSAKFKQRLQEDGFGVYRFLDRQKANTANISKAKYRKPVDYVFYDGGEFRANLYCGVTTNSGDDYSVAAPSDWDGLIQGSTVIVKFNATASGGSATLNVGGTGAKPIRNWYGSAVDSGDNTLPRINRFASLVYDVDLGSWLKTGGDLASGSQWLNNGAPYEIMVQLCEEMGAHPWFCLPFMCSDPISDLPTELGNYIKGRTPWMIDHREGINEDWNSFFGFFGTRYGWNKANFHWGTSNDHHNFQGKTLSTLGQAMSAVYAGDRTKYKVINGVQSSTHASASSSNDRMNSTKYVTIDGGSAAKNWVTDVCVTCYINSTYTGTQELAASYSLSVGDTSVVDPYVVANSLDFGSLGTSYTNWYNWANSFSVPIGLLIYEGGWSQDLLTADTTASITGVTNAVNCVITVGSGSTLPPVGYSIRPSSVGGATGVNAQAMTVTAVNSGTRQITTDFDSTGAGTYTSGGTLTYVSSKTHRNVLRLASKESPLLVNITRRNYEAILAAGGEFPSCYLFAGEANDPLNANAWSCWVDIFAANEPPQIAAIRLFNANGGPMSLKTSAETAASALDGTELVRAVQSSSNVKATVDQIATRTVAKARTVTAKTVSYTLVTADSGGHFTNTGAAGAVALTLPAAASGLVYSAGVRAAQTFGYTAAGGAKIYIGASASAANGTATANAIGAALVLICDGTDWDALGGAAGTWTLT